MVSAHGVYRSSINPSPALVQLRIRERRPGDPKRRRPRIINGVEAFQERHTVDEVQSLAGVEPRSPTIRYIALSVPPIALLSWEKRESVSAERGPVGAVGEDVQIAAKSVRSG